MGPGMMVNMEWLPPANYGEGYAASYSYSLVMEYPGIYWYVCTYPGGHAEEGMYGEIIVEPVGGGDDPHVHAPPYDGSRLQPWIRR